MGESIVEPLTVENKMGESVASGAALEVSVSFGRFENDSLSWEKWSTFSPNKYLEEVEKCSTPGSVAKKAAYFEAHYKKIAARKAELLGQEKQMDTSPLRSDDPLYEEPSGNTYGTDTKFGVFNCQRSHEQVEQETEANSTHVDGLNEAVAVTTECQKSSLVEGEKEEMESIPDSLELNKPDEVALVPEDTHPKEFEDTVELPLVLDNKISNVVENKDKNVIMDTLDKSQKVNVPDSFVLSKLDEAALFPEDYHLEGFQDTVELPLVFDKEKKSIVENKDKNVKLDTSDKSQKVAATKEENLVRRKKKLTLPLPKLPKNSTSRISKPISTSSPISASQSATKKENSSLLLRSKNPSTGVRRVPRTSLQASLNLGPANSDSTSLIPARKSFIMEKMGDKDIVKRAFKTFQNNFNQLRSSGDERSSGPKQVSTKEAEQKVSTSRTPRTANNGMGKAAETMKAEKGRLATSWNSMSSGSSKQAGGNKRNVKAAPSSFSLRSDERAEKRKEFLKKIEEKSHAKEEERTRLSSKSKWGAKNESHHRPESCR